VDPDAVVRRINDAVSDRNWGEVDSALWDLAVWIDKGGFYPSRKINIGDGDLRKLADYYQNARDTENARRIVAAVNKRAKANPSREAHQAGADQRWEGPEDESKPKTKRRKAKGRRSKKQSAVDAARAEKERKRLLRKITRI
jgi:hypothetical protein